MRLIAGILLAFLASICAVNAQEEMLGGGVYLPHTSGNNNLTTPVIASYLPSGMTSGTSPYWAPIMGSSLISSVGASSTIRNIPLPYAGVISGLAANLNASNTGNTIVDYIAGATGNVGCTFSGESCASSGTDTITSPGTLMQWQYTAASGAWAQSLSKPIQISWLYTASQGQLGMLIASPSVNGIGGATTSTYMGFGSVYGGSTANIELSVSSIMAGGGTIQRLYVWLNGTEGSNPHTFTLRKNGSNTNLFCSDTPTIGTGCCVNPSATGTVGGPSGPACGSSVGDSVTVAAGDLIDINISCSSASCGTISPGITVDFTPNVTNQVPITAQFNINSGIGSNFTIGMNDNDIFAPGTTTNWQITPDLASTMTLSHLIMCTGSAITGSSSIGANFQYLNSYGTPSTNSTLATATLASGSPACPGANSAILLAGSQDTTHTQSVNANYSMNTFGTVVNAANPSALKFGYMATVP